MADWAVLDAVARGEAQTVSNVARALGVPEAEAARLVGEAELEGLLARKRARGLRSRRRAGIVTLTPAGRRQWDRLDA